MPYCQVCLVTVELSVSVSASVNLDVKTIGIGISVKSIVGLALFIITLLFGAQQSVLGLDTPCLDSPKCMVLCVISNAAYGRKRIMNSIRIYAPTI